MDVTIKDQAHDSEDPSPDVSIIFCVGILTLVQHPVPSSN